MKAFKGILVIPLLAFSLLISTPVSATDTQIAQNLQDMSLEELLEVEVVTVATGAKQLTTTAAAVTSVITARDMEVTAATDIDEVLETVPGLHVARSSISYYNPIYALGGIYSVYNPETLVLINGIPTNTLYTGGRIIVGYGGMPTTVVSRIEVIRGPGSALYGADALSGVINIITKTQEEITGTRGGIQVGSFAKREVWLSHGSRYRDIEMGFSFNFSDTEGHRELVVEDAQTQYDQLFGTQASLAPGSVNLPCRTWDIDFNLAKDHWKFHTLYQKRSHVGLGSGGAQALDPESRVASDRVYTDLTYHNEHLTENWEMTARMSHSNIAYSTEKDFILFPAGAFGGTFPQGMRANTGVSERHTRFDISASYQGIKKHQFRLGTGYTYGEIYKVTDKRNYGINPYTNQPILPTKELVDVSGSTIAAFIPTGNRKNWHIFAQDIWTLNEQWEVTSGIRYDNYSDFGSTVNPRFALVWKATPSFITKFLYGKAFRAPSFQELYQTNNPVALGNIDLKPEKIQTYEIALSYRPSEKWYVSTNVFTYRLTNKVLFIPDEDTENYHAHNAGSQKGYGFVLEGGWMLGRRLVLTGSYAYQLAKDQLKLDVAHVPQRDIYLRADWEITSDWHLNAQTSWILDRKRAFGDPRPPVDDYANVDLSLHHKPSNSFWTATFSIRNLLDADIREPTPGPDENGMIKIPYDLPMAGINYFVGLNYQF